VRALSGDEIHCQLIGPWEKPVDIHNYKETDILLMYLHGNNEDIATSLNYRQWLANHTQANVLTCDYPGYGFSTGDPSEEGMHHAALAMLDLAITKLDQSPAQMIVLGKSIGSTPAIGLASHSYCVNLRGLILVSPVASGVRCLSISSRLPRYLLNNLDSLILPNIKHIGSVLCPIQFIHGLDDEIVPCDNTRSLISALNKHLLVEPLFVKAGHNDIEAAHTSTFLNVIEHFIEICRQRQSVCVNYED
jgi:pimeloyl-ACP methyl ester carboxylesterase